MKFSRKNVNSLRNDKILALTRLKAFADNKFIDAKMVVPALSRIEKLWEREENAGYQHFLLFTQCFEKASHLGSLKVVIV